MVFLKMSDVVIVVGTKRGKDHVSPIEIKQMIGRAGRKHDNNTAVAYIIVEEDRSEEVKDELDSGKNMEVYSHFNECDSLIFHLNTEIVMGNVHNVETAQNWFSKSLSAAQGKKVVFQKVFDRMEEFGVIEQPLRGSMIASTKLGKIASELYFHPFDVKAWMDNFTKVFDLGVECDNAAMAWALGTRPYDKSVGDFGDYRFVIEECRSAIPMGLDMSKGMVTQVVLWWGSMGGPPMGKMRNAMLELRNDIGRIKKALVRIDKECANWNRISYFDDLEMMVKKGITYSLVDLCKIPGITKGRADFLYNMGATSIDAIVDVMDNIMDDIDEPFREVLRGIRNEFSKKSN